MVTEKDNLIKEAKRRKIYTHKKLKNTPLDHKNSDLRGKLNIGITCVNLQ